MYKYEVIIYWSTDDDAYIAEAPELPGCISDGKSYQEAIINLEDVVSEWIEAAQSIGREIPQPKGKLMFA